MKKMPPMMFPPRSALLLAVVLGSALAGAGAQYYAWRLGAPDRASALRWDRARGVFTHP